MESSSRKKNDKKSSGTVLYITHIYVKLLKSKAVAIGHFLVCYPRPTSWIKCELKCIQIFIGRVLKQSPCILEGEAQYVNVQWSVHWRCNSAQYIQDGNLR